MCNLTSLQKEAILKSLNQIPIHNLTRFIIDDCFVIDDYIENGLESLKVEEVVLELEYPTKKKVEEDKDFYSKINDDEIVIQEILTAIMNGRVTEEGLLKNTIIDENLLKRIKRYQYPTHQYNNISLLKNSTDIFFLGSSGSGKSCVLASLFNYGEKHGCLIENHPINYNFKEFSAGFNHGILPASGPPASIASATCWNTKLHLNEEIKTLNFIEMSGEFFSGSHILSKAHSLNGTFDAQGYLSNKNKKLFFFIVDYERYAEGEDSAQSTQSQNLHFILSQFNKHEKSLKNTYCIYIIVNKSDLFPSDVTDKNAFAMEFFMNNFKAVYTNLKSLQEKHGFQLRLMHFSSGDFLFNNSYLQKLNVECPKNLIDSISKQAARRKRGGWFSRIFRER